MYLPLIIVYLLSYSILTHQEPQSGPQENSNDERYIKDHLGGKINSMKNMTPKQLLFFHVQDLDKNGKLDGDELIKAITDFHEEFHGSRQDRQFPPSPELQNMLDSILRDNDLNMDGHIDYNEFLSAQGPRRHSEL